MQSFAYKKHKLLISKKQNLEAAGAFGIVVEI